MNLLSPGSYPLVSSVSGLSARATDPDRANAESAASTLSSDQRNLTDQSLSGVSESEESGDRDADGRLPWQPEAHQDGEEAEADAIPRTPDAFGERGTVLDLDA